MTKGLKEFRFTLSLIAYRSGDEQMRCWQNQRRRRLPANLWRCYNSNGDLLMAKRTNWVAWGLAVAAFAVCHQIAMIVACFIAGSFTTVTFDTGAPETFADRFAWGTVDVLTFPLGHMGEQMGYPQFALIPPGWWWFAVANSVLWAVGICLLLSLWRSSAAPTISDPGQ